MSRSRLILFSSLIVGSLALPARAQTPIDSATAADSAKPKKSRFCGLVNKAKKVAENKAVQGAAKGVACTVVPGAAVVGAATGSGPCANGPLSGITNAAVNMATGAAAGASAQAVGKIGGTTGAAAQGAMSALAGGGIAGAARNAATGAAANAAQQAATMKMMNAAMGKAGGATASNAAAQAAAMKMMNEAMGKAGGAAANNAAAQAAAMKMMSEAMALQAGGAAAPTAQLKTAAPAVAAASPALWVNYDFVPGERVIFYSDFTGDQVGNFPERLEFVEGNMEVAELGGRRVMRATSSSKLSIPLPEVLPQRFTIEIDVINRPSLDGADFHLRGNVGRVDDNKTSIIGWGSDGVALLGGGGGEVKLVGEATRARYSGKPAQLRIFGDGKYIKVYLDEKRLANVPNANFERSKMLHLFIDARSEANPAYISRIRVAESRKSIYDDLAASGRVATQGLLFDTGSDQLRPESTPTMKQIAAMLTGHPELRIRIEGHTDNVGVKETNRSLSAKRAASVKAALVKDYAIAANRLDAQGLGDTKPVDKNDTVEGRQNNRRVELVKL
jgi:OmpA-OmpF porin, OOP family